MDGISEDIVIFAYKLFFGREPENKEAIEYHKKAKNIIELGKRLMLSDEFYSRLGVDPEKKYLSNPIFIEEKVNPEKLKVLLTKIKNSWTDLGGDEPYFSVLSEDNFKKENIIENQEEFYKTGSGAVKLLTDSLQRNKITLNSFSSCLEFGCGVGRATPHLAKLFPRVIACDISKPHLQLAEQHINRLGLKNIFFRNTFLPNEILEFQNIDVVFSIIVLQHNPPPLIAEYINVLLSVLNPKGIAYFQVPTYLKDYYFSIDDYIEKIDKSAGMEMHVISQRTIFEIVENNNCSVRELREDNWPGNKDYISNSFLIQKH